MRRSVLVSSIFVASLLAGATPARAYVRSVSPDGQFRIIWPNPSITMTVLTGGVPVVPPDELVATAVRAAATWSDPVLESSVQLTVTESDVSTSGPAFDHVNTISFRTSSWDPPTYTSNELALTTAWVQGGRIVDADIELNGVTPSAMWGVLDDDPVIAAMATDVDLQNALTHELGHVIGLSHPCYLLDPPNPPEETNLGEPVPACSNPALPEDVLDAAMYPSAQPGSISERVLSADEILALHDLYPTGRAPVIEGQSSSDGGCAVAPGPGAPWGGGAGAVGLLLTALRARRARRATGA